MRQVGRRNGMRRCILVVGIAMMVVVLAGCSAFNVSTYGLAGFFGTPVSAVPGGDAERGAAVLRAYGCSACHSIPGIPGADTFVGPPLENWAQRYYVAGSLPNTPENLIRWIQVPQEIEPGTAMPNLGVTEQDARDMAAYLYTLGR